MPRARCRRDAAAIRTALGEGRSTSDSRVCASLLPRDFVVGRRGRAMGSGGPKTEEDPPCHWMGAPCRTQLG